MVLVDPVARHSSFDIETRCCRAARFLFSGGLVFFGLVISAAEGGCPILVMDCAGGWQLGMVIFIGRLFSSRGEFVLLTRRGQMATGQ